MIYDISISGCIPMKISIPCEFGPNDTHELTFRVDFRDGEVKTYARASWDCSVTSAMADGDAEEFRTNINACPDVIVKINAEITKRGGIIALDQIHSELISILSSADLEHLDDDDESLGEGDVMGSDNEFTFSAWDDNLDCILRKWKEEAAYGADEDDTRCGSDYL